jgi:hypothetical protein
VYDGAFERKIMTHTNRTNIAFYQQLGQIFYAIAAADKVIRKEELDTLKTIIRSEWLDVDQATDEFGTDAAFQIEVVFDWLDDQQSSSSNALRSLQAFKKDHPSFFTTSVNELIFKTAAAIAFSFYGGNKSELTMLDQLETILLK